MIPWAVAAAVACVPGNPANLARTVSPGASLSTRIIADGFVVEFEGRPLYTFKVEDFAALDDRPLDAHTREERDEARNLAANFALTDLALGQNVRFATESSAFVGYRFSMPFQIETLTEPATGFSVMAVFQELRPLSLVYVKGSGSPWPRVERPDGGTTGTAGFAYDAKTASMVASAYFPAEILKAGALRRVFLEPGVAFRTLRSSRNGTPAFFLVPKGAPGPYFVGSNGSAYKAREGFCTDLVTRKMAPNSLITLSQLTAREEVADYHCFVPDGARVDAVMKDILAIAPDGAFGFKWRAPLSDFKASHPEFLPPEIGSSGTSGELALPITVVAAANQATTSVDLRVLTSRDGRSAFFDGARLVGAGQSLSDEALIACKIRLPQLLGVASPSMIASPSLAWATGSTVVFLIHDYWNATYGLLLLDKDILRE